MTLFKLKPVTVIDFSTLQRPRSPNTYLVCSNDFSASTPDQEAPIFPSPLKDLIRAWNTMIANQPRTEEIYKQDDGLLRTFVQRTKLVRFPDVISVEFVSLTDRSSTLALYSQSQYGYNDFGANQRRAKAWLSDLTICLG